MKCAMLFTGSGPLVVLTSYNNIKDPSLINKLAAKGIDKFIAYNIPMELAKQRYGGHFQTVLHDLIESDDLRILDFNGQRAFHLFHLDEMGGPMMFETDTGKTDQGSAKSLPPAP